MKEMIIQWFPWLSSGSAFGEPLLNYVDALLRGFLAWAVLHGVVIAGFRFLGSLHFSTTIDQAVKDSRTRIRKWFLATIPVIVAVGAFEKSPEWQRTFALLGSLAVLIQVLLIANVWIRLGVESLLARSQSNLRGVSRNVATITIGTVWFLAFIALMDNFGFNVSTALAGLGVGGIAIGLASQSILGDLFASFAIGLDRPFEIGDYVTIDNMMGTVESIGIKTTRIRSLSGELLVFSNSDLVSSRIRNYKRMRERRIAFRIGVTYDTGIDWLKKIPQILQQAVESQDQTRFDRAHFFEFGDSALIFETVYIVLSPDYSDFMDIQEKVNLHIATEFEKSKISFAFPTTTIDFPAQNKPITCVPPSTLTTDS